MRIVGEASAERNSRSLPIWVMFLNISFRFPATVISSTGYVSSPFSIQMPFAPREKSPVTRLTLEPRNPVTYNPCYTSLMISCADFVPSCKKKFPAPIHIHGPRWRSKDIASYENGR